MKFPGELDAPEYRHVVVVVPEVVSLVEALDLERQLASPQDVGAKQLVVVDCVLDLRVEPSVGSVGIVLAHCGEERTRLARELREVTEFALACEVRVNRGRSLKPNVCESAWLPSFLCFACDGRRSPLATSTASFPSVTSSMFV